MAEPYQQSVGEVLAQLGVDPAQGLSAEEAAERLRRHGLNELVERPVKSPWKILVEQLKATLILILIAAAILSAALGDFKDAGAILAIVILNAWLGVRQNTRPNRPWRRWRGWRSRRCGSAAAVT